MGAARIGDDQRIPFRYGQGRDDGRVGRFEIDFVEAAAGDARLVEQAAGLAEIFVFGKMGRPAALSFAVNLPPSHRSLKISAISTSNAADEDTPAPRNTVLSV